MNRRLVIVLAGSLFVGSLVAGCVVVPRHRAGIRVAVPAPAVAVSYRPLHYQGNVVFYTGAGVPFFYADGARVYLPSHARHRYVRHYRTHRHAYRSWERQHRRSHKRGSKRRGSASRKRVLHPNG